MKNYYFSKELTEFIEEKEKEKRLFPLAPARHVLIIVSAAVICLHLLTRKMRDVNVFLSESMIQPAHQAMAKFFDRFPFSLELHQARRAR